MFNNFPTGPKFITKKTYTNCPKGTILGVPKSKHMKNEAQWLPKSS
jgi:hypothetical protein